MSDNAFNFLIKYYSFSKKYMPFVFLGIMFILSLLTKSFGLILGVYLGLSVLHLVVLFIIKRITTKVLLDSVSEVLEYEDTDNEE